MLRTGIIALAAAVSLGAAALAPDTAAARMGGGHGGLRGGGHFAAHHFVPRAGFHRGFARNRFVVHNRFAFRHHAFRFRHRFFRHRFAFAAAPFFDDDCLVVRHVWRPWGWTWRRVWVC